jgi:hypothetical protein
MLDELLLLSHSSIVLHTLSIACCARKDGIVMIVSMLWVGGWVGVGVGVGGGGG